MGKRDPALQNWGLCTLIAICCYWLERQAATAAPPPAEVTSGEFKWPVPSSLSLHFAVFLLSEPDLKD